MQMRSCWRHFGEGGASITPRARAAEPETPRESVAGALVPDAEPRGRSDGHAGKTGSPFPLAGLSDRRKTEERKHIGGPTWSSV